MLAPPKKGVNKYRIGSPRNHSGITEVVIPALERDRLL